jgi:hypothetical protein
MSTKSEYAETIGLRGIAANIGSCYEKSFLSFHRGNPDIATDWDKLGSDITFIGRQLARGKCDVDRLKAEYVQCMDRWDSLNARM